MIYINQRDASIAQDVPKKTIKFIVNYFLN